MMGEGERDPPPALPEATVTTTTCTQCGYQDDPEGPRQSRRGFLNVVDEIGSTTACGICAVLAVTDAATSTLQITLMISRPEVSVA
jgi:hypothetical protein